MPRVSWLYLYGGTTATFQFRPALDKNPYVFVVPFFGVEFLIPEHWKFVDVRTRQHGIALHTMWFNPWDTSQSVMGYKPVAGVIAVYLGYRLRFGGIDR